MVCLAWTCDDGGSLETALPVRSREYRPAHTDSGARAGKPRSV